MAVGIGGLGVAAFHPEGARYANYASGSRRGTGMSLFSVGGNAGFALGPILITPAVLIFGLSGTLVVAILPLVVALVLAFELPQAEGPQRRRGRREQRPGARRRPLGGRLERVRAADRGRLRALLDLLRPAVVRADLVHPRVRRHARRLANGALAAMLVAGAIGTLVGGRLVDRIGRRAVLVGSIVAQVPLLLAFMLAPSELAAGVLLAAIGFVTVMSFSVSVVMGQEYLPSRLGIASGVTMGFAIGVGGIAAAILGMLADAAGLETVMWTIAALPLLGLALALPLPLTPAEARAQSPARLSCVTQPSSAPASGSGPSAGPTRSPRRRPRPSCPASRRSARSPRASCRRRRSPSCSASRSRSSSPAA